MQGKRILFATLGSLGDLFPYLAAASEMQRRGHQATILTGSQHRSRIEQSGVRFLQVAPNLISNDKTFVERAMNEITGGRYLLRDVMLPQIRLNYENLLSAALHADLLVTQMLVYAGPLVAEKTGIPWVSTVLAPLSFFSYRDSPVLAAGLSRLREAAPRLNALINRIARSTTQSWSQPVYQLRKELGLARGGDPIYDGQHSPSLVLAMFSPLFASAQTDWPRQTRISGFPFWEEPGNVTAPPALEAFLEAGPPPVVFTLGSSAVWIPGRFYEESRAAVRMLGVRAVMLDGGAEPAARLDGDILSLPYAPHPHLFERAAAIVHSGGIGTCATAMRAGRPSLVVPFAYDQPDNAARLVRLGIARTIGRRNYTARRAATEIGKLLAEPHYRANAEQVSRAVKAERGTANACDALERSLSGRCKGEI